MLNRKIDDLAFIISLSGFLLLSGCQTPPIQSTHAIKQPTAQTTQAKPQSVPTPDGIKITPYDHPEIKREKIPVVVIPKQ